jgi:hypothetical protein
MENGFVLPADQYVANSASNVMVAPRARCPTPAHFVELGHNLWLWPRRHCFLERITRREISQRRADVGIGGKC